MNEIPRVVKLTEQESEIFDKLIKAKRKQHIRTSQQIVDEIFLKRPDLQEDILENKKLSYHIKKLRTEVWEEFLLDEVDFNAVVMKDLHKNLETPKEILDNLINDEVLKSRGEKLRESIQDLCGEYAGRVFPYLYKLSLSNTQSRRSRAGKTFEAIIYRLYELMSYEYDSQGKCGRKIFSQAGLGKKVDSVLPGINQFNERRNKTIIGTMKTSLRERWQEVAEEIERTKIPEIHLLTADETISFTKASEMSNHNIVIVTYSWVAENQKLKDKKNIISFEEYFFEEIPAVLKFWK